MGKKNTHIHHSRPPHPLLLALVAQFLEQNGFNSSHRIYNTERRKRPKKEGWQGTFGRDYTAKAPSLEAIFKAWQQDNMKEDSSEVDSKDDLETSPSKIEPVPKTLVSTTKNESSDNSDSTSETSSDSDLEDGSVERAARATPTAMRVPRAALDLSGNTLKRKASFSSADTSSADEKDSMSASRVALDGQSPMTKKRRVEPSPSDSETTSDSETDTDSDSSSDPDLGLEASSALDVSHKASSTRSASSETTSTDESSSESESSSDGKTTTVTQDPVRALSDSSGTVVGDAKGNQSSSDSSSSESSTAVTNGIVTEKKHIGAQPTKLAQLSASANPDDYISNTYVSYDYADKAYRDLSITRGKGFTKEKNKKKRGSYRGGAIDISGGKGFKFDD